MTNEIIQLSPEDTKTAAIFSTQNAPNVSSRYQHITTAEVVGVARQVGWEPFKFGVKRRNSTSIAKGLTSESAGHFVALRPSDEKLTEFGLDKELIYDGGPRNYSHAYPNLVLKNSHDTTGRLLADLGIFEMICSNMVICQSDSMGQLGFRHTKSSGSLENIKDQLLKLLDYAPWIMKVRNTLSKISVTKTQALNLAERSIPLRWDNDKFKVNPEDIIRPRFAQQSDLSAYNVFQTVQRALTHAGDFQVDSLNPGKKRANKKVRVIKNFSEERRINKGLWLNTTSWLSELGYDLPPSVN